MSTDFGDDSATTKPDTMRGRNWPSLRQFCIFMENRVGRLSELLQHIERAGLRVIALSILDSVDCAIARVMVDHYERGREVFELGGFATFEIDVIGVELPDHPQPYVKVCTALLQAEINIHYTYPLLYRRQGKGAIALCVDDIDLALTVLDSEGHRVIAENDLMDDDEFF